MVFGLWLALSSGPPLGASKALPKGHVAQIT